MLQYIRFTHSVFPAVLIAMNIETENYSVFIVDSEGKVTGEDKRCQEISLNTIKGSVDTQHKSLNF